MIQRSTDSVGGGRRLEALRAREFSRLDADGSVYVDFTGAGLYGASQVRRHGAMLADSLVGNPHSLNPASVRAEKGVADARRRVLGHFRADPDEYVVIFTANASHALKLVAESYPFTRDSRFLLTADNHNSVNGIREFARARGASTTYLPLGDDLRVSDALVNAALAQRSAASRDLFAFPAQSNFSGVQHPLEWIGRAQSAGWDVLLDAAAFVPTNRLDLSRYHPDFVSLSFYKMFGYPTGVGALIARVDALAALERPWFAGGTIAAASVRVDRHVLAPGVEAFEDGTVDYLGIPAIGFGFDLLDEVGIDHVHANVARLTERFLSGLRGLRHDGGEVAVRILGPESGDRRGGTVALNLYRRDGARIELREIEVRAAAQRISLRTGCFCNPGASESALHLTREDLDDCFPAAVAGGAEPFRACLDARKASGAVRISFGIASNEADVDRVLDFARALVSS